MNLIYISKVSKIRVCENKKYWFINNPIGYGESTYENWIKNHPACHIDVTPTYPIAFDNKKDARDYCFKNQPLYTYNDIKGIMMDIIALYATDEYNDLVWNHNERKRLYDYLLKECMKTKKRPINDDN